MKTIIGTIRGYLGLAIGILITLVWAAVAYTLGTLGRLGLPTHLNPAHLCIVGWAWMLKVVCYERIMGLRVIRDPVSAQDSRSLTVLYANHPALEVLPLVAWFAGTLRRDVQFVAKKEILRGALGFLVGKAAYASGRLVIIDRENRSQALADIGSTARGLRSGSVLVLFCDGHRPTQSRLETDRAKYGTQFPAIRDWVTCLPHSGGITTLLTSLDAIHQPFQLYHVGVGFDRPMKNGAELRMFAGSTLHFWVSEMDAPSFPRDPERAKVRLITDWQRFHRLLYSLHRQRPAA